MFLQELGPIEAEAFLTLACEMIEDDGIICLEENDLLDQYQKELGITGFSFDPTAAAAARHTLAQLDEVAKRKVYMELFSIAVCDCEEDVTERITLTSIRDALALSPHVCSELESCVYDLYSVYDEIEEALELDLSEDEDDDIA